MAGILKGKIFCYISHLFRLLRDMNKPRHTHGIITVGVTIKLLNYIHSYHVKKLGLCSQGKTVQTNGW